MHELDRVIGQARHKAAEQLSAELRRQLLSQSQEWLVDRLVEHILSQTGLALSVAADPSPVQRAEMHQVRPVSVDEALLAAFLDRYASLDRTRLETEHYLLTPPDKGGPLIGDEHRSPHGAALLCEAKNLLYALLFGTETDDVRLTRVERELLTITIPRAKMDVFGFLSSAATEIGAQGTWRDPQGTAHDNHAANTLLQIEYGETADESVGRGIVATLRLINDLEVNEQILYARMENIEQSTLI